MNSEQPSVPVPQRRKDAVAEGKIDLKWLADGQLILHWTEIGGPTVHTPAHKGFGDRVIEQMIGQLKGKARFDWRSEGVACEITLPA
jgi:two-component sensor histidine kinase